MEPREELLSVGSPVLWQRACLRAGPQEGGWGGDAGKPDAGKPEATKPEATEVT